MKKVIVVLALMTLISACKKTTNDKQPSTPINDTIVSEKVEEKTAESFSIEDIPYSTADIGEFPFFTLPEGLESTNKPFERKFDVCFFPISGVMTPFEGRLYKIFVRPTPGEQYSRRYFEKSMDDYLISVGAVKVFDGEITKEEYERYHKQDPNKGADGDIGYWNQRIQFYVIRNKEKGTIYVQFTSDNSGGKLNVLLEESFKQTIKKVTADEISKDLTEKGKSILYINFDVDKANLTQEGQEVVSQIAEALTKDPSLKISIEGHTDNSGNAAHNKNLSNNRANEVLQNLTQKGIDKTRLSAKGLGSENPLVANDSEENKAKNRRVELVRIN